MKGRPNKVPCNLNTSLPHRIKNLAAALILSLFLIASLGCASEAGFSTDNQVLPETDTTATAPLYEGDNLPIYQGEPYVEINGGIPTFTEEEMALPDGYECYSPLDDLGRCGPAIAVAGPETIPTEGSERENIGHIHPSGWIQEQYDCIPGKSLYNRSHLIARELTAEEANPENLITGTQYMNQNGMRAFEDGTRAFIDLTGSHVLFRATPVFIGEELLARGVQIEALSLDDGGEGVAINVYCYNVQPGIVLDYLTGASRLADDAGSSTANTTGPTADSSASDSTSANQSEAVAQNYILNTNTHRFHKPDCNSAKQTLDKNKESVHATRQELIDRGCIPCSICNP